MRRVTAILLSALLGLSLIGCGGGSASGNDSGKNTAAAAEAGDNENTDTAAPGTTDQIVSTSGDETEAQAAGETSGAGITGSDQAQETVAEETTAAPAEPAGLDPAVKYKEEEETLLDTDLYSIKVTGYDPDFYYEPENKENEQEAGYNCFAVKIRFENKSGYDFRCEGYGDQMAAVNRNQGLHPSFNWDAEKPKDSDGNSYTDGFEVAAGEGVDGRIQFRHEDLSEAGITSVDEVIMQMSGTFIDNSIEGMTVHREYIRPRAVMYPTGKTADEITPAGQTDTEKMTVLADKEDVLVTFMPDSIEKGLPFYIENHTDDMVRVSVSDQKINGEKYYTMVGRKKRESTSSRIADVLPGCHLQKTNLFGIRSFMEDNSFDRMTEYSAKLTVSRPMEEDSEDIMEAQYGKGGEIFTEDVDWKAEE